MIIVETSGKDVIDQPDFFQQVGDYLTRVASAVVSVFKRIFCIEDMITPQDMKWNAQKCRKLQMENRQLEQSNKDLQFRVERLQRNESHTSLEKFFIEAMLFVTLCPLYILSIPVILVRDSLYSKKF